MGFLHNGLWNHHVFFEGDREVHDIFPPIKLRDCVWVKTKTKTKPDIIEAAKKKMLCCCGVEILKVISIQ